MQLMHALIHLLSRNKLTYEDVQQIMDPYDEQNVYSRCSDDFDEEYHLRIPQTVIYPQFMWDYYTIQDKVYYTKIEDCYVLIDPDGWCIARTWWNGNKHIDQTMIFEAYINEHRKEWEGKVYMIEIDIHW